MQLLLLLLPVLAAADSQPDAEAFGFGYGFIPQVVCKGTNTTVQDKVCVPAFKSETESTPLAIKEEEPEKYCFDLIKTVCEERVTDETEPREVCTTRYRSKATQLGAATTQVTYKDVSDTMKVTTCEVKGDKHYPLRGVHQYCHETYQTQSFKVPVVTVPLKIEVNLKDGEEYEYHFKAG